MKRVLSSIAGLVAFGLVITVITRLPSPQPLRAEAAAMAGGASERGQVVYQRYGCGMCHGEDGTGGFANLNAASDSQVPAVIYAKEGYSATELRRLILNGTAAVGKAEADGPTPPYRMPGWRGRITEQELNDLVEYLFSLYPESDAVKW